MSSLLYLGLSAIMFLTMFGLLSMLTPMILGTFFSALDSFPISDPAWNRVYQENKAVAEMLVPLTFSMGIVLFVIKLLMVATSKGRD